MPGQQLNVTCKMCGQSGFTWGRVDGVDALVRLDNPNIGHHVVKDGKIRGCVNSLKDNLGIPLNPIQQAGASWTTAAPVAPAPAATPSNWQEVTDTANKAMQVALSTASEFGKVGLQAVTALQKMEGIETRMLAMLKSQQEVAIKIGDKPDFINVGRTHKDFVKLVKVVRSVKGTAVVFLDGEPGSMKTSVLPQLALALSLGDRYFVTSLNNQTSRSELLGYMSGHGEFVETPAYKVCKNGGIWLLDEVDASNANGLTGVNTLATNAFVGFPNGEVVQKHEDCYIIAAGNTIGSGADSKFIGRNQLDMASRTRFVYFHWATDWDYVAEIVRGITGSPQWAVKVRFLHDIVERRQIQFVVSSRVALTGARLIADGFAEDEVLDMMVWPNLSEDERRTVSNEYLSEVG